MGKLEILNWNQGLFGVGAQSLDSSSCCLLIVLSSRHPQCLLLCTRSQEACPVPSPRPSCLKSCDLEGSEAHFWISQLLTSFLVSIFFCWIFWYVLFLSPFYEHSQPSVWVSLPPPSSWSAPQQAKAWLFSAASEPLGNLLEMQILRPTPNFLHQKLWKGGHFGVSDACLSWKSQWQSSNVNITQVCPHVV